LTNTIVVMHQGTDIEDIMSIVDDAQFALTPLNATRFPSAPTSPSPQVHDGFQKVFENIADVTTAGVEAALSSTGATHVLVTGHSLGGATASMSGVYLRSQLASDISINVAVFGLPRGGDQAWASFVDSTLPGAVKHVTNENDPVPTLPPMDFGCAIISFTFVT
jgi:hypothetical protein